MLGGISPPAWSICRLTPDHHLTTTVQLHLKMPKKPIVTTNNRLFPVLGASVQNRQILRFNASLYRPVVVLRCQVPGVRIPSGALKKRIAMYFCNALFGLMLFWFQNHFSSLSSSTSVYCLFAGFSFLSLFIVVRIGTVVREVGFLFTKASYSIAASDRLCKTCPISALMQTDCRSISCGQTACPWLMQT